MLLIFLIHRYQHPPTTGLLAVEEDHFVQRASDGNVELPVIVLVLEIAVALAEDETLHEIPEDVFRLPTKQYHAQWPVVWNICS